MTIKNLKSLKRSGYLEWDEYYMVIALLQVRRGAHKKASDGAIILDEGRIIISAEFNSFPDINISNPQTSHAEFKAVQNIGEGDIGHVMYTTSFPCAECAEAIGKAGINEIIYCHENTKTDAATEILDKHGVVYRRYVTDKEKVVINFNKFCDGNSNNDDDDDDDSDYFEMPLTSSFDCSNNIG